ncbi:MAG: polyphosphate kinase 1 [Betaproteobacteria bacterium]|nr:polyphosphate kinase 1 [Betaproteobacteria bacterium]
MIDLTSPDYYINRELSLLAFNERVLAQAEDPDTPPLERLRFLCIVSSNLDEFFEIRMAGLKEHIKLNGALTAPDGMLPKQTYRLVAKQAHRLVDRQYRLFNETLLDALAAQDIRFLRRTDWTPAQQEWVRAYFFREVIPVLTPIGLDPAHPFPRVLNKSLNFAVSLEGNDAFGRKSGTAIVQAPRALPRVIRVPDEIAGCEYGFVFLSSVLHAHVGELFAGMRVLGCYQFRVTRNSDLFVDEEEVKNLRLALQGELPHRHFGDAVRLEVADNCPAGLAAFLLGQFGLEPDDLYQVNGPVNLVRLMQVPEWVDRPALKFPLFVPRQPAAVAKQRSMFQAIARRDVLVHHPFESFQPVIDFIQEAADDPHVVAIKQTVYRTGPESTLMEALIAAAERGKDVTVVVELLARFDEEANINWAARLEQAGAHVVYGVVGYKTHAKMALVVRREGERLRRYVHLGTGNYHPRTTKLYTDFGLFTCNEALCADAHDVFSQLTGLGQAGRLAFLWQSPFTLHRRLMEAIQREIEHAQAGRPARIIAKMNSLLEPQIIRSLYRASQTGVPIDLIVRGACALRPGIPGVSDNIRVRSVVGRFLEHTRIFHFANGGEDDVYLSSADWMDRNFFRRIELCFPVIDPRLKRRVINEGLKPYLRDNTQAWAMTASGGYERCAPGRRKAFCAQDHLLNRLAMALPKPQR